MDYLITMDTGEQFIAHHGVKGQKWGVWNPETAARRNGSKTWKKLKTSDEEVDGGGVISEDLEKLIKEEQEEAKKLHTKYINKEISEEDYLVALSKLSHLHDSRIPYGGVVDNNTGKALDSEAQKSGLRGPSISPASLQTIASKEWKKSAEDKVNAGGNITRSDETNAYNIVKDYRDEEDRTALRYPNASGEQLVNKAVRNTNIKYLKNKRKK